MNIRELKEGIRDGFPICVGYFAVSIAFGLSCVKMGIPLWIAVLISLTNLTSAGQFAGATLLVACANYFEIVITLFIINMRYVFMSLSLSQKVDEKFTLGKRLIASFGITDEIFAVSVQRRGSLSFAYMVGLMLTPIAGWTLGTLTGAAANSVLPAVLSDAFGIALYAMFIAIIIPPAREEKSVLIAVIIAIVASYAFEYLPILKTISSGWSITIITIVVSAVMAYLFPIEEEEAE